MPIPNPKPNEKQPDFINRCMHDLRDDDTPNKQKAAICYSQYSRSKKSKSMEIDFSEEIKNMNKIEQKESEASCGKPGCGSVENVESKKIEDILIKKEEKTQVKGEVNNGEIIQTTLMQMQHQYKILHWQTTSFSQHKAFDEIVSSLSEHIDEFIETYMGKYGRVIAANKFNFSLSNYKDTDYIALTNNYISFLISLNDKLDKNLDSDLLNIRDEILGSLNQLKYLLSLN